MACEFLKNEIQEVVLNAPILFDTSIPCSRGNVYHEGNTGNFILKGASNSNCCNQFAQYQVTFNGNIAIPEGGTAAEIQLALAIDGEVVQTSIATATPTVAEAYWNVSGFAIIDVPAGCCYTVSVENASISATPATTPAPALNLRNLNVEVTRLA